MMISLSSVAQTATQRLLARAFTLVAAVNLITSLAEAWPALGESIPIGLAFFISKALLMPVLAVFLLLCTRGAPSDLPLPTTLLAFFFCWGGDVILGLADVLRWPSSDERRTLLFACGIGSFGLAHLFYIYTFLRKLSFKRLNARLVLTYGLPFAVYSYTTYSVIHHYLTGSNAGLRIPIAIYMCVLIANGFSSFLRRFQIDDDSSSSLLTGVILFVQSDTIIALNRFVAPLPIESFTIMATYILGQSLIVNGCILRARQFAAASTAA